MVDGVQATASDQSGEVVENISGAQSFVGAPPQKDPMIRATDLPPEGIPAKFWDAEKGALNTDALLKSYTELEKKIGASKEGEPGDPEGDPDPDPNADPEGNPDPNTDQAGDPDPDPDADPEGDPDPDPNADPEGDPEGDPDPAPVLSDAITTAQSYFQEHGDLPTDARKDLHALGISDEVIDLQISGARAYTAALQTAAKEAAGVDDYGEVEKAIAWAAEKWTPKKIMAFNAQSGDIETIPLAITALFKDYRAANPGEGKLLNLNTRVSQGDVYETRAEFQRDLAKADKERDPIARAKIIAKMDRSLKASSLKK